MAAAIQSLCVTFFIPIHPHHPSIHDMLKQSNIYLPLTTTDILIPSYWQYCHL